LFNPIKLFPEKTVVAPISLVVKKKIKKSCCFDREGNASIFIFSPVRLNDPKPIL